MGACNEKPQQRPQKGGAARNRPPKQQQQQQAAPQHGRPAPPPQQQQQQQPQQQQQHAAPTAGEQLEAFYEGAYYPARITEVTPQGYNIEWYDGSVSFDVPAQCLRRPGGAGPPGGPGGGGPDPAATGLWQRLGARSESDALPPEHLAARLQQDRGLLGAFRWPPHRATELVQLLTRRDRVSSGASPVPAAATFRDIEFYCRCRSLFDMADRARQGRIDAWELETVMAGGGAHAEQLRGALGVPAQMANALLRLMDVHNRGFVELPEWCRHWFHTGLFQGASVVTGSESEQRLVHRLFPQGRGGVRAPELRAAMDRDAKLQLQLGWPAHEADRLFQFLDADRDGVVTAEELSRFVRVQCVFNRIDDNFSGFIDPFELGKALENPRMAQVLGCSAADAQRLWKTLDADGSGAVTFAEFFNYFADRLAVNQVHAAVHAPVQQQHQNPRDKYQKLRVLGEGTFGRVFLIKRRSDGLQLILKEPKPVPGMTMADVELEASMLSRLKHPHIVRFVDQYWDGPVLIIVTEFADGGDLRSKVVPGGLPPEQALQWFEQTCAAINYLHARRIIHRDLKPDNIFLTSGGSVKVGDLGMAKELSGHGGGWQKAQTECGTQIYMAPEIFRGEPYADRADVWALGCILHELATGSFAFSTVASIVRWELPRNTPQYCQHIVRALLAESPAGRPDMPRVLEMLGADSSTSGMASYMSIRKRARPGQARQ
eukprot:TRINITY_DN12047_c0_g1_i1.p1 TRINITY_DN12047_c0_g1~~TRINITY_DN12047_c0_g1_i1.p1  ORF type:complete len:745 (+),score=250.71 TRINITY_DN12047_c0_g1_i1:89-2236(+)